MIGVFDSGLGGLCSLRPLRDLLPHADIFYLADTASLPLGEKSADHIRARLFAALRAFEAAGVCAVLLACGTASSLLTQECKESFPFRIFDIITPTAKAAKSLPRGGPLLLLSTAATARAGVFASALAESVSPVFTLSAPALVQMAEGHRTPTERHLRRVLSPALLLRPKAVVLGCTHFSLLKSPLSDLFPQARLIDAAACGAAACASHFLLSKDAEEMGTCRFAVTGDPLFFARAARGVLGRSVTAEKIKL